MRAKLISSTNDLLKVIFTAARTCYNPGSPVELWLEKITEKEMLKLIKSCVKSGHHSVLEHANFTFAIEGISRACSMQLIRHRHLSISQKSQRYVEIKEDLDYLKEILSHTSKVVTEDMWLEKELQIVEKYFVVDGKVPPHKYFLSLVEYASLIKNGLKPEDARNVLPNATKTDLVITCNLRELIHICHERLCSRAQLEIRKLVKKVAGEVLVDYPWLEEYLQPKCKWLGYCPEMRGCKKELSKKEFLQLKFDKDKIE